MSTPYYNEGLGHGAFVASFQTAGNVILEDFTKELPSAHKIMQSDQIGAPLKWAGISGFVSATATAQLPVTAGTVTEILRGDRFTAPAAQGGGVFIVTDAGESFRVGDYWKANLQLMLQVNTGY